MVLATTHNIGLFMICNYNIGYKAYTSVLLSWHYFPCHRYLIGRIPSSFKYSSKRKSNAIQILNFENKNLYGSLLETQKQRKKAIKEALKEKTKIIKNDLEITSASSENEALNPKKSQKRGRKPNSDEVVTLMPSESSSLLLNMPTNSSDNLVCTSLQNIGDIKCSEGTKTTTKKTKKSSNKSEKPKDMSLKSNEFVFKSIVPIDETNYPLQSPGKQISIYSPTEKVLNYSFSDSVIKYCINFPSVSKIMEETMSDKSKSVLDKWQQNMINSLGPEGFKKKCEDLKSRGHAFHSAVSDIVLGKSSGDLSEVTRNALKSLEWMLEHVSNPIAVESITAHPTLEYKGIPDCVVHFRGIPAVVDWKLSDKPKKDIKDTYDAPVQITAYIGALNHDPNYKIQVNHGLVAVAYTNGDPCDVFLLAPKHCQIYWRQWLLRCDKFKARSHLHTDHDIDERLL